MSDIGRNQLEVMLVDDEAPARELLSLMLAECEAAELLGGFSNGADLLQAMNSRVPDLLLLDIGLPGEDGVELARHCIDQFPSITIVFVTAYNNRAIEAFELNALDYLLKPVDDRRLRETIERARLNLHRNRLAERIGWASEAMQGSACRDKLIIRSVRRIDIVYVAEVQCLLAAGNYVEVHLEDKKLLHRTTLEQLERDLDPAVFMRVHRSALVNRQFVRQVLTRNKSRRMLVMANGTKVPVSDSWLGKVQETFDLTGKLRGQSKVPE